MYPRIAAARCRFDSDPWVGPPYASYPGETARRRSASGRHAPGQDYPPPGSRSFRFVLPSVICRRGTSPALPTWRTKPTLLLLLSPVGSGNGCFWRWRSSTGPALLVLDEPTAGLDPQARRALRSLIQEMRAEGRTVLLSTHDLEEAAQLCDQVAIMDGGRLIAVAPPAELIARSTSLSRVIVRTSPPCRARLVCSLPHLHGAHYRDCGWVLDTQAPNRPPRGPGAASG